MFGGNVIDLNFAIMNVMAYSVITYIDVLGLAIFGRIGVKLGEFGDGKRDIGSREDGEMIERAGEFLILLEVAECIILGCQLEFCALFERSRCRFGVRHVVFSK